jgi:hypothetical protein
MKVEVDGGAIKGRQASWVTSWEDWRSSGRGQSSALRRILPSSRWVLTISLSEPFTPFTAMNNKGNSAFKPFTPVKGRNPKHSMISAK